MNVLAVGGGIEGLPLRQGHIGRAALGVELAALQSPAKLLHVRQSGEIPHRHRRFGEAGVGIRPSGGRGHWAALPGNAPPDAQKAWTAIPATGLGDALHLFDRTRCEVEQLQEVHDVATWGRGRLRVEQATNRSETIGVDQPSGAESQLAPQRFETPQAVARRTVGTLGGTQCRMRHPAPVGAVRVGVGYALVDVPAQRGRNLTDRQLVRVERYCWRFQTRVPLHVVAAGAAESGLGSTKRAGAGIGLQAEQALGVAAVAAAVPAAPTIGDGSVHGAGLWQRLR